MSVHSKSIQHIQVLKRELDTSWVMGTGNQIPFNGYQVLDWNYVSPKQVYPTYSGFEAGTWYQVLGTGYHLMGTKYRAGTMSVHSKSFHHIQDLKRELGA